MCAADMPDIIVVDGALAGYAGRVNSSAASAPWRAPSSPQIMICLVEVDIGAIMRAKRAGAQGYLLKPFNRPQLLERFRSLQCRLIS